VVRGGGMVGGGLVVALVRRVAALRGGHGLPPPTCWARRARAINAHRPLYKRHTTAPFLSAATSA